MKEIKPEGGDSFDRIAGNAYSSVLIKSEKLVTFNFNGVRVIIVDNEEWVKGCKGINTILRKRFGTILKLMKIQ